MIGSTLQLSLNRAKVSFLPCGTNEKFINLCRIAGPVSYFNCQNLPAKNKTGKRWGTLPEILCFHSTTRNKWRKTVNRELKAIKNPTNVPQRDLLFQRNHGLLLLLLLQLHWLISRKAVRKNILFFPFKISYSSWWRASKHRLSQSQKVSSSNFIENSLFLSTIL